MPSVNQGTRWSLMVEVPSLFSRPLILTFYLDCHPFILAKSLKKKNSIHKTYIFGYKKSIMI